MGPIGHFAVGLAVKPAAPKAPLWVLLLAGEVLDLLCFAFFAIGIERNGVSQTDLAHGLQVVTPGVIPWSHGLFMALVWSAAAGAMAVLFLRDRRAGLYLGLVVFSHWLLDFIVHPGELPLFLNGSPTVGLGLWSTGPGLVLAGVLEVALFAGGLAIYLGWRKQGKRRAFHAANGG
jgi:hypothetical protein